MIVHSVSESPLGPFQRREVVVDAFAHNPTVSQAPDGTWVLYHIGCGTPNKYPKCEQCSDGRTGGCPRAHEQVACTLNTTHLMHAQSFFQTVQCCFLAVEQPARMCGPSQRLRGEVLIRLAHS